MKLTYNILLLIAVITASCNSNKVVTKSTSTVGTTNNAAKISNDKFFDANKARINRDFSAAKKGYLQAIKDNPSQDAAYYYVAKIILAEGNNTIGRKYAGKAVELDSTNKYYLELYADASAACDDYETAIGIYKNLAVTDVKFAENYLLNKAYYESKSNKLDDAVATINEIEKYYGVNAEMSFRKINILKKQEKYDEVIKKLDELIADDPSELKYYLLKVDMYNLNKQADKAKELKTIIEKNFTDNTQLLSANTLKAFQDNDTAKYLQLLHTCMTHKGMDVQEKIALLLPLLKLAEKDSTMQDKALGFAKQLVETSPNNNDGKLFYGGLLVNKNLLKQAAPYFYQVLQNDTTQLDAWQQLMNLYAQQQLHDSVIVVGNRAAKYFPKQASLKYLMGFSYQSKLDFKTAIEHYYQAIEYAGGNEALQTQAFASLGDVYNTIKNYNQSDSCFNAALALDAEDAMVLNNYAYFLSVRNAKLDIAEKMSKKSLEIRKGEKTFLDTYAWILYKQKKYTEASKVQKEALDEPGENDATMYEHYGDILFKLGDSTQAKKYWLLAKEKGSSSESLNKKIETNQLYE